MDDTEEQKVQLLESIKLQEAALSATIDSSIITFDSDSDIDEDCTVINLNAIPISVSTNDEVLVLEDNRNNVPNPSWAEALSANMEYDSILAQLEADIKQNILKVSNQLDEVRSKISSASTGAPAVNLKSQWMYIFGMPYFKDNNFYPCPFNEDYLKKKTNQEILWSDLPTFQQWTSDHKKILTQAVRELSLAKCEKDALFKLAVLRKELATAKLAKDVERIADLESQVELFDVSSEAKSMVTEVIENGEHDWMQISAKYLQGKQSPDCCRSFWYSYMHPKINKAPYTEEEESRLASLAERYEHQDWDTIAKELGTNRSGYQCFIVYQNKLNSSLRRNNWDPEEDTKLIEIVEKYRIGEYIPWGKVTYHMDGRTKTQVFNRWSYSINPAIKKGRFTKEEDIMILVGVQMWGEDFQRISNFIKDRTTCQVRDRYKHYLSRPGLGIPWTIDDDKSLFKLVDKHGRKWAKIAEHFPYKDRTQVRHRYTTLARWRMRNPDARLTDAPARCFNPQKYKDFQEQWAKAKSILSCETVEEMVKAKNALVASFLKRKRTPDCVKKKKPSVIENDLVNYFRCSFDLPGGRRKTQLRAGEAKKYADELKMLLPLLKANLNVPSVGEIMADSSLSVPDKEILKILLSNETDLFNNIPSDGEILEETTDGLFELESTPAPLYCDAEDSKFTLPSEPDIDYVPSHDISSLYIDLPLMNFTQDEVVADKNQDPSFFEPVALESTLSDQFFTKTSKQAYMCPPNLSTLVGLRTFLLNRRTLLTWCNEDPKENENTNHFNEKRLEEAQQKFDERMLFLFLWPALMSRCGPSTGSIFEDDDTESNNKSKKRPRPKPIKPQTSKKTHGSDTEVLKNIQPTSSKSLNPKEIVGADSAVPSTSRTSGPPKKRPKLSLRVESDDDPDDPDII